MTTDIKTIIEKLAVAAAEGGEYVAVPSEACMAIIGRLRSLELERDNWRTQAQLESEASLAHALAESAAKARIAELESRCDTLLNSYEARSEHWDGLLSAERAAHLATQRALVDCANEVNDAASDEVVYAIKRLHGPVVTAAREAVEKAGKEVQP